MLKNEKITKKDILLYYPNVIGYIRLSILMFGSIMYTKSPLIFIILYTINILLDYIDGMIARKYKQISNFGAVLDITLSCLGHLIISFFISNKINKFLSLIIFFSAAIDFIHKYCQFSVSFRKKVHWKNIESNFILVIWYYRNNKVFDTIYLFQNSFLILSVFKAEYGFYKFPTQFIYFFLFWGYLLNSVVRFLAILDCFYKIAQEDSKKVI